MKLKIIQQILIVLILISLIIMIRWKLSKSFTSPQPIRFSAMSFRRSSGHLKKISNLINNTTIISEQSYFLDTILNSSITKTTSIIDGFIIPSVVLTQIGGIGNQLFRFAFAYSLSQHLGGQLYLNYDGRSQAGRKFAPWERSYALDQFQLDSSKYQYLTSMSQLPKDQNLTTYMNEVAYFKNNIPKDKIIIVNDYWESEIFFKPYKEQIIRQYELIKDVEVGASTHHNEIIKLIESSETESVAVHFRYGDFHSADRLIPFSYQWEAMQLISDMLQERQLNNNNNNNKLQLTFFIFSDDITNVKKQFERELNNTHFQHQLIFVSNINTTSLEEFYLMLKCSHMIIANSTFSWWAAYLIKNKHKIIIAPYPRNKASFPTRYYHGEEVKKYKMLVDELYAYPNDWITLNPYK